MRPKRFTLRTTLCGTLGIALGALVTGLQGAEDQSGAEFFEKKIRPLLVQHCYECHSANKSKGNLRLDLQAGWLQGGDSGPAIVAGRPDESLLISAIRRDGLEMPPTGKLPDEAIRLFEEWVKRGAPATADPDIPTAQSARRTIDLEAGRQFWAYQPVRDTSPPAVDDALWSKHPIDCFLWARLQAAGLKPQPSADRATLARRLYFDLWGMPPTVEELTAIENDSSADWYDKLVDQLLASPRFGERWARHWLDIVRYGESLTLRGFILPDAWRYRNYTIETFNADRPYFQFLREQLAGDLLPAATIADRQRQLVATTFLTLGNTNLEEQDKRQLDMDVVDEQLDVIGKAFLGQTIGCARCHDHKFDPIPTRDYYALAGILRNVQTLEHANVSKWMEVNLPLPADEEAPFVEHEARVTALEQKIAEYKKKLAGTNNQDAKVVSIADLRGIVIDDSQAKKVGDWQQSQSVKPYVGAGYAHDQDKAKGEKTATFTPELPRTGRYEVRLAYTAGENRSADVPVTVFSADGEKLIHVNMQERPPLDGTFLSLGQYRCEAAGQNFVLVANEGTKGHVVIDAVQYLALDDDDQLARADARPSESAPGRDAFASKIMAQQLRKLEKDLIKLQARDQQRPHVITVVERPKIEDAPIHLRGSVHTLGDVAPRGFLQVVAPAPAEALPNNQSGRVEMANWIASPENPLTARVFTNRVWHWLFGQGLVRTVDNFGTTGEVASHPELLDHLACYFVGHDTSLKQLIRYIVTSQAYRQSSAGADAGRTADPENRLLWRQNRQRLEAECLRDAMLSVSGTLRLEPVGSAIRPGTKADYDYVDADTRRSIYVPVLRNALPELFEAFDFADPSLVVGRRDTSTVVQQALFMENSPFVREQAMAAAGKLWELALPDDEARLLYVFRQTLGRPGSADEANVIRGMLAEAQQSNLSAPQAWAAVYHMVFSSLDFRYRD
jgi:hypothetical protein